MPLATGLLISLFAGLSTAVGGVLVFFGTPKPKHLTFIYAFSAGVMIHVSYVELLSESIQTVGFFWSNIWFLVGMLVMFAIDQLIPHDYAAETSATRLKTGVLVALGIAIHNFPEGIVVLAATLHDPRIGLSLALAIALHNIPEGLAVAGPVYDATKKKGKAFAWSLLAGLAEPIGALFAALILLPFVAELVIEPVFGLVAGIMVFISLHELVPAAKRYGHEELAVIGSITGIAVIGVSLWFLASLA